MKCITKCKHILNWNLILDFFKWTHCYLTKSIGCIAIVLYFDLQTNLNTKNKPKISGGRKEYSLSIQL